MHTILRLAVLVVVLTVALIVVLGIGLVVLIVGLVLVLILVLVIVLHCFGVLLCNIGITPTVCHASIAFIRRIRKISPSDLGE